MRAKSIAVFLIVVVLLIAVSLWQVDSAFYNEQKAQGEGAARAQLASIVPGLQAEFRSLGEHTKLLASLTVDKGVSEFTDSLSYRVEMIARLHPTDGGEFVFENKSFHEKTPVRNWAENYTTIALKALRPRDVVADGAAIVALMDPQRKPFFLWIFRDEKERWSAVVTKPTVLQGLMDRQKGLYGTVIVVNQQGQVLGHTTSEYVGTSLAEDPIIREVMKSGRRTSSGFYDDASGQKAQGFFEIVPASNTYVVLSRPMAGLQKPRDSIRWQLLLLGGGFLFVGLAATIFLQRGESAPPSWPNPSSATAGALLKATPGVVPVSTANTVPQGSITPPAKGQNPKPDGNEGRDLLKERMKAYTTSAAGLARELQGPTTKIMALSKSLLGGTLSPEQHKDLTEIEELARDSRGILRKLLSFAGEDELTIEPTSANESLNRALAGLETKLNSKGVKVEKNFKRVSTVAGNSQSLSKALEAVLQNSIEAMERMPTKKLTLDLEGDEKWTTIKLRDTGDGISPENLAKIFDPFYSSKNRSIHSGLGLSMALGVIHEFGGDIHVTSEVGKGTVVEIRLPVLTESVAQSANFELSEISQTGSKTVVIEDLKRVSTQAAEAQGGKESAVPPLKTLPPQLVAVVSNLKNNDTVAPPAKPPPAKVEKGPPAKPPPAMTKPSLLHERAIQETMEAIDGVEENSPKVLRKPPPPPPPSSVKHPEQQIDTDPADLEQFVEKKLTEKSSPPPIRGTEHSVSIKIDRPQIAIKVAPPKLPTEVAVRKPGEKPFPERPGGRR